MAWHSLSRKIYPELCEVRQTNVLPITLETEATIFHCRGLLNLDDRCLTAWELVLLIDDQEKYTFIFNHFLDQKEKKEVK